MLNIIFFHYNQFYHHLFLEYEKYLKHIKKASCKNKTCPGCKTSFSTHQRLNKHLQKKKKITCDHCAETFCNQYHFHKHLRTTNTANTLADLNRRIYPPSGYENDEWYSNLIESHANVINDYTKIKTHYETINRKIDASYTYKDLYDLLVDIYSKQKSAFKINIGFGFILYNPHTGESKYFYVSSNFEHAFLIHKQNDLTNLMKRITSLDLETNFYLKRPTSGWVLAGLTNIELLIIYLKHIHIG